MNKYFLIGWFIFLSIFLLIIALDLLRGSKSKLAKYIIKSNNIYDFAENIAPFVSNFTGKISKENLTNQLLWSGNPFGLTPDGYYALRLILGLLGFVIGVFLYPLGFTILFAVLIGFVFSLLPTLGLRSSIEKRQDEITMGLPNMVNLVATAVWAGIELGPALRYVSYHTKGALGEVMRDAWKEIATGKSRGEVLKKAAKNTGVAVFERFIDTITVAEERGGQDLSRALMDFGNDMVQMQRQYLDEKGEKVPTKMLLPLVLCIFVPMLILLLTPILINALQTF